jgi:Protein of unknown function (DUF2510)
MGGENDTARPYSRCMATGPEAGWYDDGHGKQRWWDGAGWTEQYIDLNDRDVELRAGAAPGSTPAAQGWYDDGRGRQRWWNGTRWTDASRFSGSEESFAGIVVDGRWIHFGTLSQSVAGAAASVEQGADLLRRGVLGRSATARALYGPGGPISPRLLKRAVAPSATFLLIDVAGQLWLASVPPGQEPEARRFAGWIRSAAEHYRYR